MHERFDKHQYDFSYARKDPGGENNPLFRTFGASPTKKFDCEKLATSSSGGFSRTLQFCTTGSGRAKLLFVTSKDFKMLFHLFSKFS